MKNLVLRSVTWSTLAENPGLQSAFIQSREKPEKLAGTFLLLNLAIGLTLFAPANLAAPAMATSSKPHIIRP